MNNSNPPKPMECRYVASLRQLDEGEAIRIGDFFQTFLGNLARVTKIDEDYKVGSNRQYYRVSGLQMIEDEPTTKPLQSMTNDFVYGWDEYKLNKKD